MPKKPPTRSAGRATICFLIAAFLFAWTAESIVRGRVSFDGKYGHVEHRGAAAIFSGLFIFGVGCASCCFGMANLNPNRCSTYALRAGIFGVAAFGCVLLSLLCQAMGFG